MTNNDIFRRIRFIFDFSDAAMVEIFGMVDCAVTRDQVIDWLKQEEKPGFIQMNDIELATFLDGLIVKNRGRKEGPTVQPESVLNNNIIFRKLRIALEFNDVDVIEAMKLADFSVGKQELSALFRNPNHKNYRKCQDQMLRNFLKGLQIKFRPMGAAGEA